MKVRFLTPLDLRAQLDGTWTTIAPLDVELAGIGVLRVPVGFNTDLASVPRLFWNIIPPFGSHEEAATAHDWLYRNAGRVEVFSSGLLPAPVQFTREAADLVLLAGMKAVDVPPIRREIIFRAVRLFGRSSFRLALTTPSVA